MKIKLVKTIQLHEIDSARVVIYLFEIRDAQQKAEFNCAIMNRLTETHMAIIGFSKYFPRPAGTGHKYKRGCLPESYHYYEVEGDVFFDKSLYYDEWFCHGPTKRVITGWIPPIDTPLYLCRQDIYRRVMA